MKNDTLKHVPMNSLKHERWWHLKTERNSNHCLKARMTRRSGNCEGMIQQKRSALNIATTYHFKNRRRRRRRSWKVLNIATTYNFKNRRFTKIVMWQTMVEYIYMSVRLQWVRSILGWRGWDPYITEQGSTQTWPFIKQVRTPQLHICLSSRPHPANPLHQPYYNING